MRVWISAAPPPVGVSTKATDFCGRPTAPFTSVALMPVSTPADNAVEPPPLMVRAVGSLLIVNPVEAEEPKWVASPAKPAVTWYDAGRSTSGS